MTTSDSYVLFEGDIALWTEGGTIMLKTCDPSGDAVELNAEQAATLSRLLLKLAEKPESK
jgi:hypothetical protein